MGGWLCVAVAFIKRRASDITTGWDDKIDNALLNTVIKEVLTRVHKEDSARADGASTAKPLAYGLMQALSLPACHLYMMGL